MRVLLRILKYRKTINGEACGYPAQEFLVPEQTLNDAENMLFEETLAEVKRLGFDYQLIEQQTEIIEGHGSWPGLIK